MKRSNHPQGEKEWHPGGGGSLLRSEIVPHETLRGEGSEAICPLREKSLKAIEYEKNITGGRGMLS